MMGFIVVGLGPGSHGFLTQEAWETLTHGYQLYLRTSRHPVVAEFPADLQFRSFDHIYETAENFDEVYDKIVGELIEQAQITDIVYAVPGHPYVGEATVTKLIAQAKAQNIPFRVVPGLSFVEPVLTALGVDALDGLQIFDALVIADHHYPPVLANTSLLLAQVYNRQVAANVKLALFSIYPENHSVYFIHAAGSGAERIEKMPLFEIDRRENIDHLSSLFIPALGYPATLPSLADTVATLRSPDGCPWDIEQTPKSMREGFLEEAYEVLEAIDEEDVDNLREELGDLLYHLVMQTQMASEDGDFSLTDVIAGIDAKLKRRHPHVWGDWNVEGTAEVLKNWELLKKEENQSYRSSLLDGIPENLPSLAQSQKIQNRVAQVGFDWPDIAGIYEKIDEERAEIQAAASLEEQFAEVGDLLFTIVNLSRRLQVDAESALREANLRFSKRFRLMEKLAADRGLDFRKMDLNELDEIWEDTKKFLANADADAKV